MVLHPLEFSDCYLDSPWFRENIQQYEEELEKTNSQIKHLIKDAKNMINACRNQNKMMTMFNDRLQHFQFDFGQNLTDDEKGIAGSLKEFGLMLEEVTGEWSRTIERSELQLIKPLEEFRKGQIHSFRETKKSFEKASERYYKQLEHTLGLSHKKKGLQDSDNDLFQLKRNFHKEALNYVYKLQEVQERKKFEFVEHLLMFMQVYFNYFHQSHETANDCKEYMKDLQMRLVATRQQYEDAREKTQDLMTRMAEQPDSDEHSLQRNRWSRAGYLFLMEKNPIHARLTSKWTKYFCMYTKENKLFQTVSAYHSSNTASSMGSVGSRVPSLNLHSSSNSSGSSGNSIFQEPVIVKTCTRRSTDSIDKRFCFDLEVEDTASGKQTTLTLQALSDSDRKKWMAVMDGKEPEYVFTKGQQSYKKKEEIFHLNETGFTFVKSVVNEIEKRGVHHEGIYRLVGVMSKVNLLLQQALNPQTVSSVDYSNEDEWETNTLTSALKSYFRNLPEPIMTFDLHRDFIDAAKCESHDERVTKVAALVKKLPANNQKILAILAEHLEHVQACHEQNKMTVQNLGVCFGPTLMRDRQETVQAIMEIKFSNIIAEILIEERNLIFSEESSLESVEKPKEHNSPRILSKTVGRLPSQRLKQRPRGNIYTITSVPGILEDEQSSSDDKKQEIVTRFNRSMAFRNPSRRSPSPRSNQSSEKAPLTVNVSSSDDDGYGHISPLDLNLNFNDISSASNLSQSKSTTITVQPQQSFASSNQVSKRNSTPNGGVKSDNEEPLISFDADVSPSFTVPSPKGDASSVAKQQSIPSAPSNTPVYTQVDKTKRTNVNNSNNKSDSSISYPPKPVKPKGLAVSTAIKERKKKMLASVRENFALPSNTTKNLRKNVMSMDVADSTNDRVSNSPATAKRSMYSGRRPKSEFIPRAFLVEEYGDDIKTENAGDGFPSNPVLSECNTKHFEAIPRSSPLVTGRTFESAPDKLSSESENDVSDGEITSTIARTLYACEGEHDNELSFQPGQLIRDITKSDEPGWLQGSLNGRIGLVPRNYVDFI